VTNAVKHFKFARAERGKRRIHRAPSQSEIVACRPWLVAELALVQPELLVCLGASAAKAVLGPDFRVSRERGLLLTDRNLAVEVPAAATAPPGTHPEPPPVLATIHPAAVLRALDRDEVYAGLVADLRVGARALH
jgi:DNA polymerase